MLVQGLDLVGSREQSFGKGELEAIDTVELNGGVLPKRESVGDYIVISNHGTSTTFQRFHFHHNI